MKIVILNNFCIAIFDIPNVSCQLQSLKTSMWNGNVNETGAEIDIYDDALELLRPFRLSYNKGLVENFSTEAESVWATNIKRSIAGILQLDLINLEKHIAFHSTEVSYDDAHGCIYIYFFFSES